MNPELVISAAKRIMYERGTPQWVRDCIFSVASERKVPVTKLLVSGRSRKVVEARNEAIYRIKETKPNLSLAQISQWFGRDPTSILYGIARHAEMTGKKRLNGYDLTRRRAGMR